MSAMNRKMIQNLAETLCKEVKHCRYLLTNVFSSYMPVNIILYNIILIKRLLAAVSPSPGQVLLFKVRLTLVTINTVFSDLTVL